MSHKKIGVAHIITLLELGGAQYNTLYTVTHLNKTNFTPILIAGKGAILDADISQNPAVQAFHITQLKRTINPWNDMIVFWKIYRLLKRIKPDVVHTHSSKAGILGRWAACAAGVPVIIHTYHGFGFHEYQNKIIHYLYIAVEKLTALITTHIICVSYDNVSYAIGKKIGKKENYSVIRSGIPIKNYTQFSGNAGAVRTAFNLKKHDKLITMIACFKKQKNCIDFITVARMLLSKTKIPSIKFLLIGDGEQRGVIEHEIRQYNISAYIMLPGWRRDIEAILNITDIFVLTSLWEGLPRSAIEALVSGVPVVANSVDGLKEIIKDGCNGYLCEPRNTAEMTGKLYRMLTDISLYKTIQKNTVASVGAEFDIDGMVRDQEQLYNKLLQTDAE